MQPNDTSEDRVETAAIDLPLRHQSSSSVWPSTQDDSDTHEIPRRYEVRERDGKLFLRCKEAPGVEVSVDNRFALTEAEARKLGERVILLDGAGQFAPLVDDAAHLYNLDHHRGCLRAFTLAACEQALLLVVKGLDLDQGDWRVIANEPDLDTVFAMWVLLNYRRVRKLSDEARDSIVPLLRLEGAIDANGFEIAEYCGLPREEIDKQKEKLDSLHRAELEAKQAGSWNSLEGLATYCEDTLARIDQLVYSSSDFSDYTSIEKEYGHVDIGDNRVAVVCRDDSGIYEVEKRLKQVWGERLGIIALEKDAHHFTLRRSAPLAGIDLNDAYRVLNLLDPTVDGRPADKQWGGSDDIGGSPRPGGTRLSAAEISRIIKLTYKRVSTWHQVQRIATACLWAVAVALGASLSVVAWRIGARTGGLSTSMVIEVSLAAVVSTTACWWLTRRLSHGWTWLFGWRRPAGLDWLLPVPLIVLGALAGGIWVPQMAGSPSADLSLVSKTLAATALLVLATELCFRGLVHGLLILDSRIQSFSGRWFVSRPVLVSAVLYGVFCGLANQLLPLAPASLVDLQLAQPWSLFLPMGGAIAVGLGLGLARERSLSVWPGALVLFLVSVIRLVVTWLA